MKPIPIFNKDTEDLGVLASSETRITYDWFCSSERCCEVRGTTTNQNGKTYSQRRVMSKIIKYKNVFETKNKCPDCNGLLFSKLHKPLKSA